MKAFLDTSSMIKHYILETGSDQLESLLDDVTDIVVAPLYWLELNSALYRRLKEKTLTRQQVDWIRKETGRDLRYLNKVIWNDNLEQKTLAIVQKYAIKTLDSIQLASGILATSDVFITSDKQLFKVARRIFKNSKFI